MSDSVTVDGLTDTICHEQSAAKQLLNGCMRLVSKPPSMRQNVEQMREGQPRVLRFSGGWGIARECGAGRRVEEEEKEEDEFIQNRTSARRDSQRGGTNRLSRNDEAESPMRRRVSPL